MLDYYVSARRIDSHESEATTKAATITLDTDMAGRQDAFILKGAERVVPMLQFDLRGMEVALHGVQQDSPPKMISITYEITVDTDETDAQLALLHKNQQKFGTIYNTLAGATELSGTIRRKG